MKTSLFLFAKCYKLCIWFVCAGVPLCAGNAKSFTVACRCFISSATQWQLLFITNKRSTDFFCLNLILNSTKTLIQRPLAVEEIVFYVQFRHWYLIPAISTSLLQRNPVCHCACSCGISLRCGKKYWSKLHISRSFVAIFAKMSICL